MTDTLDVDRISPALLTREGRVSLPVADEIEAAMRMWRLPMVRQWALAVRREARGEYRPVARIEALPCLSAVLEFRRSWRFWLGEEHPGLTVAWRRIEVDAWTGEVRVWDPRADLWHPVRSWFQAAG